MNLHRGISLMLAFVLAFGLCVPVMAEDEAAQEVLEEVIEETLVEATEAPTPQPTEAPTAPPTEAPTAPPTEQPTETPTEAPTEEPEAASTEAPGTPEPPVETPVVTPAPTETPSEAPTEEPVKEENLDELVEDAAFEAGYASIEAGTIVYASPDKQKKLGIVSAAAVAYAETEADLNWFKIALNAEDTAQIIIGYVQANRVEPLNDDQASALEKELENDKAVREYKGKKLPAVAFEAEQEVVPEMGTTEAEAVEEQTESDTQDKPREETAQPEDDEILILETEEVTVAPADAVVELEANDSAPSAKLAASSVKMGIGGKATFKVTLSNVEATDKVSYLWQISSDKGSSWSDVADQPQKGSYTVTVKEAYYGVYRFRCVVTIARGDTSYIKYTNKGQIKAWTVTVSPKSRTAGVWEKASFSAKPSGSSGKVKYQWEYSWDGGSTWKNIAYTTKSVSIEVKKGYNDCLFRVKATAKNGYVYSEPVTIKAPYTVTMNKTYARVNLGSTTSFTVKVPSSAGEVSAYRWYYSVNNGKSWREATGKIGTGLQTRNLKMKLTAEHYGYKFACLVTTSKGRVMSPAVYVEPKNAGKFKSEAKGSYLKITGYTGSETTLTIPAGLKGIKVVAIGDGAFKGNKKITKVTIPSTVTTVGRAAFQNCTALKTVIIPDTVKKIYMDTFAGDTKLTSMTLPETLVHIGERAFANTGLKEINLPSALTFISAYAFSDTNLQTVTAKKGTYAYTWARNYGYLTEYKALLIGERTFLRGDEVETVLRNVNDVTNMAKMLDKVYTPLGSKYSVTKKTNQSASGIRSAIRTTFADTMDQDVSLFFIATHGKTTSDGDLEMAFTGDPTDETAVEAYRKAQFLSFETLASWLTTYVKGRVIVILESCGAGSAIYTEPQENATSRTTIPDGLVFVPPEDIGQTAADADETFVAEAIAAFSAAQQDVEVQQPAGINGKSTGNLRLPKYYVLAAAAHGEESWGYSNTSQNPQNLFTKWLIQGVGTVNSSPADTSPKDNRLVLNELYTYIQQFDEYYPNYTQHVQCYPTGSGYEIFRLK